MRSIFECSSHPSNRIPPFAQAVEELEWSYAPSGIDECSGTAAADSEHAATFIVADLSKGLIGDKYRRRRYVSYEPDGHFSKKRTSDWPSHAGIHGPTLRVAVGEVLKVRLLNRGRHPASLHVHGVALSSVALLNDTATSLPTVTLVSETVTSPTIMSYLLSFVSGPPSPTVLSTPSDGFSAGYGAGEIVCGGAACAGLSASNLQVASGKTMEFTWTIGDDVGPTSGSSVGRLYSELTYAGHTESALSGILVVVPRGAPASSATTLPTGVAAERMAIFSVSMEMHSPFLALNVLDFVWRPRLADAISFERVVPATTGGSRAAAAAASATSRSSGILPIPSSVTPGDLLAALFNAAIAHSPPATIATAINSTHSAITSALGSSASGLAPQQMLALPTSLLGVSLGAVASTLFDGEILGLTPGLKNFTNILDASAYIAVYGQWALEEAVAPFALVALESESGFNADEFAESNTMHGLNGLLYCNQAALPGSTRLTSILGSTTRWYVAVLGTEVDLHAAHWHGNTVLERASVSGAFRSDSIALLPRQVATADMDTHSPGTWLFHCHVTDHIDAGMLARYDAVSTSGASISGYSVTFPSASTGADSAPLPNAPAAISELAGGRLREYFVGVDVGNWSYLSGPAGASVDEFLDGSPTCGGVDFAALDAIHNGSFTYSKARFVRYTDATFTKLWVHPTSDEAARWRHLALLGPVFRAEVGDMIRIWLRNNAPTSFSLHPHGVLYAKGSEGAPYVDGTSDRREVGDNSVQPGETWPYTWFVPESSGPGPGDVSSIPWLYHGHVHESGDENSGLVGVLLVTGKGKARVPGSAAESDLRPSDVDRELVVMAKIFNEAAASEDVHMHGGLRPHPTCARLIVSHNARRL